MAIYNFYREPIFKYYKEQIDFLLRSRENLENINIKKSLNMNLILSSACFTEGVMEHLAEYYGAAEPPVRCGVSHMSGLTEPPVYSYSA